MFSQLLSNLMIETNIEYTHKIIPLGHKHVFYFSNG